VLQLLVKEMDMSDTKHRFLKGLSLLIENEGYSAEKISRYVFEFSLDYRIDDSKLNFVIDFLKGMDAGPEFELSEEEFWDFIANNI